MKIRNQRLATKKQLPMTSMIDVVFQLLIFFVMTFQVIQLEGDFNIRMPKRSSETIPTDVPLPFRVRLVADASGGLVNVRLDGRNFNNLDELQSHIVGRANSDQGPDIADAEAEFDCDYNLRYDHVVQAITAVSGTIDEDGEIIKLIEKIKFSPPEEQK